MPIKILIQQCCFPNKNSFIAAANSKADRKILLFYYDDEPRHAEPGENSVICYFVTYEKPMSALRF